MQFKGCKNLITFGEMCVMITKKTIQGHLNVFLLVILIIMQIMRTEYSTLKPNKASSQEN
jgi:hypothetical protein